MARVKVIVKRLSAIEDFGGMNVLCTDKTGTLTEGAVRLSGALDVGGHPSADVLQAAYLNALYHSGFGNPIDEAILHAQHVETVGAHCVAELPYDFQRRRLSVLVARDSEQLLLTKGAVDSVLDACATVRLDDGTLGPLRPAAPASRIGSPRSASKGIRVLGVAQRTLTGDSKLSISAEADMTFLGFVTFLDPPKAGVDRTLRELGGLGISVRMITGDNRLAAAHVASSIGMDARTVVSGQEPGGPGRPTTGRAGARRERLRRSRPDAETAHHSRAAACWLRRWLPGRRYQRRAIAARGGRGHLG